LLDRVSLASSYLDTLGVLLPDSIDIVPFLNCDVKVFVFVSRRFIRRLHNLKARNSLLGNVLVSSRSRHVQGSWLNRLNWTSKHTFSCSFLSIFSDFVSARTRSWHSVLLRVKLASSLRETVLYSSFSCFARIIVIGCRHVVLLS
jgi:hypothetical protein